MIQTAKALAEDLCNCERKQRNMTPKRELRYRNQIKQATLPLDASRLRSQVLRSQVLRNPKVRRKPRMCLNRETLALSEISKSRGIFPY